MILSMQYFGYNTKNLDIIQAMQEFECYQRLPLITHVE